MVYRTIRQGVLDMSAMFDLVDTPGEIVDAPDATVLTVPRGHVRFEGVRLPTTRIAKSCAGSTWTCRRGRPARSSACRARGKSTIARLLFRFYDLTGGAITIDGQDIAA
jgi:ATP-binding cassette subfamily B protein